MAAGTQPLFDGVSSTGWRAVGGGAFPVHCWSVEDGCLKALVAKPAFQDIRTVDADGSSARKDLEAAGGLYEFQAPSPRNARPSGEFNTARIIRRGALIEHWLNGVRVVQLRLDAPEVLERMHARKVPAEFPRRTPIVLQNHGSQAWFRHLMIRSL